MSTLQGLRQARARAITGTSLDYNGDFRALFEAEASIPAGTTWNGACLLWINARLGASFDNLPQAQQAFADNQGVYNWSSIGTFASAGPQASFSGAFSAAFNRI